MHIDIISAVPKLLDSVFAHSIVKRAQSNELCSIEVHDIRNYSTNKHNTIDDYQFGGGAGMVIGCEPLAACIDDLLAKRKYDAIIYLTPDGETFSQKHANAFSLQENLLMICGHYKGIDQRIRDIYVTHEFSIGDYVLSGGELAAAVLADAIIRLIPGALNNETSALSDSFMDNLLAPPVYTRPQNFRGLEVPPILLSGHEAKIQEWRYEQSVQRTKERRPDLLKGE
jgi:tRNA (guanine37-N1)-methyltransferase